MVRIIPWSLPSIAGGSQGGYTPAPTPTPSSNYYNVDNVQIVRNPLYGNNKAWLWVDLTGIVVEDLTGISSVTAFIEAGNSATSQAAADSTTKSTLSVSLTESQIQNPNTRISWSGGAYADYWALGKLWLVVYDGNGEILKTIVLSEDIDGGA